MTRFITIQPIRENSYSITIAENYEEICIRVAEQIARAVREKPNCVLGLATGSSPLGIYAELIRMYRDEGLDFSEATCFNLDEYYPLLPENPMSYHAYMKENLFDKINCRKWFLPDVSKSTDLEIERSCADYEERIQACGGIDLQLIGFGRSGHIGFNEPGSAPDSTTRLVKLHPMTRADAAPSFGGLPHVPTLAVTMGIKTILSARTLIAIAVGESKAEIVRKSLSDPISSLIPATYIRTHPNARIYLDPPAARLLCERQ